MIEILKRRKKKLFCAFVDFQKAFDISRAYMWQKLLQNNITATFFIIVHQMYQGIKSCIRLHSELSELFPCNLGVRQGENLSPILFSLYLNDLESYLLSYNCVCVLDDLGILFETGTCLLCLLYADDTQDTFYEYCNKWKLTVNREKMKIIIFNGNANDYRIQFMFGNNSLENYKEYKYLGLTLTKLNKFNMTKTLIVQRARKAMYLFYLKQQKIIYL